MADANITGSPAIISMVGSDGMSPYTVNGRLAHYLTKDVQMKQYKVVDSRNRYRDDPTCEIMTDTEKLFVINKIETSAQGNKVNRTIILNPRKFQEERIVDEQEAILLMLKGIKVEVSE